MLYDELKVVGSIQNMLYYCRIKITRISYSGHLNPSKTVLGATTLVV